MKKKQKKSSKLLWIVAAITAFVVVVFLLAQSLTQAKEANQLMFDTMASDTQKDDQNKEELLQELSQVGEYLDQMEETVVANQKSLSAITIGYNDNFLNQCETLEQKINYIQDNLKKFLITYGNDDEEIRNLLENIGLDLEAARKGLEESHGETRRILSEMEESQNGRQEELKKLFSVIKEDIAGVKEKLEQTHKNILKALADMEAERETAQEEEILFLDQMLQELTELITEDTEQLMQKVEAESNDIQILFEDKVQYLSGRMDELHIQINTAKQELNLLLSEMEDNDELRQEEIRESFINLQETLLNIQTYHMESHEEVKNLFQEVKELSKENHSELVNVLGQMEAEMAESSQTSLTRMMESMNQLNQTYLESFDSLQNEISNNFQKTEENHTGLVKVLGDMGTQIEETSQNNLTQLISTTDQLNQTYLNSTDSLKNEVTNNFRNMDTSINEQITTLESNLTNHYESLTTIVNTGDNGLKSYLENVFGSVNQKLESVFTSVSSGKRLLASALLTKGVSCKEDATFREIYQAILKVPQQLVIGVEQIPGTISYDYHYHVNRSGGNPHTEQSGQSGGCYTIPVYHVHTGKSTASGGCYTVPVYHSHSGSCYSEGNHTDDCPRHTERHSYDCGTVHDYDGDGHGCDGFIAYDCGGHRYLSCNLGSGIIGYSLGCGKNTSSIDAYRTGCGFSDGQITGAHIVYTGGQLQAAPMNRSMIAEVSDENALIEAPSENVMIEVLNDIPVVESPDDHPVTEDPNENGIIQVPPESVSGNMLISVVKEERFGQTGEGNSEIENREEDDVK